MGSVRLWAGGAESELNELAVPPVRVPRDVENRWVGGKAHVWCQECYVSRGKWGVCFLMTKWGLKAFIAFRGLDQAPSICGCRKHPAEPTPLLGSQHAQAID